MKSYSVTFEEPRANNVYIPDAYYLKRSSYFDGSVADVAKAARSDGVMLISDMEYVPDGVYIDTPKNRAHIALMIKLYPKYRMLVLTDYACERLAVLEDFEIPVSLEEKHNLGQLKDKGSIDRFMRKIYDKHL